MSEQTAVQWLHYHLLHLMQTKEWRSKDLHIEKFDELFIEALTMEKEQIMKAYWHGSFNWETQGSTQYYNETYGGEP